MNYAKKDERIDGVEPGMPIPPRIQQKQIKRLKISEQGEVEVEER